MFTDDMKCPQMKRDIRRRIRKRGGRLEAENERAPVDYSNRAHI